MEIELASLLVKRDYTYEDLKAVFDRPEARFFLFHFVFDFCVACGVGVGFADWDGPRVICRRVSIKETRGYRLVPECF